MVTFMVIFNFQQKWTDMLWTPSLQNSIRTASKTIPRMKVNSCPEMGSHLLSWESWIGPKSSCVLKIISLSKVAHECKHSLQLFLTTLSLILIDIIDWVKYLANPCRSDTLRAETFHNRNHKVDEYDDKCLTILKYLVDRRTVSLNKIKLMVLNYVVNKNCDSPALCLSAENEIMLEVVITVINGFWAKPVGETTENKVCLKNHFISNMYVIWRIISLPTSYRRIRTVMLFTPVCQSVHRVVGVWEGGWAGVGVPHLPCPYPRPVPPPCPVPTASFPHSYPTSTSETHTCPTLFPPALPCAVLPLSPSSPPHKKCSVAVGTPLVVTQEDCLVSNMSVIWNGF